MLHMPGPCPARATDSRPAGFACSFSAAASPGTCTCQAPVRASPPFACGRAPSATRNHGPVRLEDPALYGWDPVVRGLTHVRVCVRCVRGLTHTPGRRRPLSVCFVGGSLQSATVWYTCCGGLSYASLRMTGPCARRRWCPICGSEVLSRIALPGRVVMLRTPGPACICH